MSLWASDGAAAARRLAVSTSARQMEHQMYLASTRRVHTAPEPVEIHTAEAAAPTVVLDPGVAPRNDAV